MILETTPCEEQRHEAHSEKPDRRRLGKRQERRAIHSYVTSSTRSKEKRLLSRLGIRCEIDRASGGDAKNKVIGVAITVIDYSETVQQIQDKS